MFDQHDTSLTITYNQAVKALKITFANFRPRKVWGSLPHQPLKIEFDGHDQIVGLRLFETEDFSFQNKLGNALQHPEVTFNPDNGSLHIVLVLGVPVERTFDWQTYIDVDENALILGIETLLTSLEIFHGQVSAETQFASRLKTKPPSGNYSPGLSRTVKRLVISPDGATLFHCVQHQTAVWDIEEARLRFQLEGELQGVSNDGQTFLSRHVDPAYLHKDVESLSNYRYQQELGRYLEPPCVFRAWDTRTGQELALQDLSPATYRPAERTVVFANRMNPAFLIKDLLADTPPRIVPGMDEGELENWLLAPDAEHIAAAYHVGAGGFDTTVGHCHALTSPQKGFDFKVYSSANSLHSIFFSVEHNLMLIHHDSSFDVYNLTTEKHLRTISWFNKPPYRGWGSKVVVNPKSRWQIAINHSELPYWGWNEELRQKGHDWNPSDYANSVLLADTSEDSNEAKLITTFKQTAAITDIGFLPDGIRLAVLLDTGEICLWNTETGKVIDTLFGQSEALKNS